MCAGKWSAEGKCEAHFPFQCKQIASWFKLLVLKKELCPQSTQYDSVMNSFSDCDYGYCSEMAVLQVPRWCGEVSRLEFHVQTLTHVLSDVWTTLTFHSLQTRCLIVKDPVFPSTDPASAFTCVLCSVYSVTVLLLLSPWMYLSFSFVTVKSHPFGSDFDSTYVSTYFPLSPFLGLLCCKVFVEHRMLDVYFVLELDWKRNGCKQWT